MKYPFKKLVFEGGGAKGVAYVGALEALTEKGIIANIDKVAGSSAGAIVSVLIGLGYANDRLKELLSNINFMDFIDIGAASDEPNVLQRLFTQYGLAKGDVFFRWFEDRFAEAGLKKDLNFQELDTAIRNGVGKNNNRTLRHMYLTGANLATGQTEIYSHETTPTMRIVDAVRISMSIPGVFVAKPNIEGDLCVDGGMLCNYPIRVFDYDLSVRPYSSYVSQRVDNTTLGFRLSSGDIHTLPTPNKRRVNNVFDYLMAVLNCYYNAQSSIHLNSNDWARTVYIDCKGMSTMQYDMTAEQKKILTDAGLAGTYAYLDWYDSAQTPSS